MRPLLAHVLIASVLVFFACAESQSFVTVEEEPEFSEPEVPLPSPDDEPEPEEPVVEEDAGVPLAPDGGVIVPAARRLSRPTLRVMTYNIKHAGLSSVADIAQVIREQKPDLVSMNEVGVGTPNQGKRLGDLLGMRSAFVKSERTVGNAVLSRFVMQEAKGFLLPSTSLQRALLLAKVEINGQVIQFGSTHLAHDSHFDRMNQMRAILERMSGAGFQVLGGDFNAHPGKSPEVLDLVEKSFSDAWKRGGEGRGPTAPALNPDPGVRIDYLMLGQGYGSPVHAVVPFAPTQSDHRPVVATLIKPWSQSLFGVRQLAPNIADRATGTEVGVKVRFQRPGIVEGVRFYRGVKNPDGYRINLWSADGLLLNTALVQDPAEPGWIEAGFRAPIKVRENTTYVVSYFSSNGRYAKSDGVHATRFTSGDVVALGADAGNGWLRVSPTSAFPTEVSPTGMSYLVDVRFRPDPLP
jgi:endonuclease/exonuclease/phosphatase family metal-dependent hydrolase